MATSFPGRGERLEGMVIRYIKAEVLEDCSNKHSRPFEYSRRRTQSTNTMAQHLSIASMVLVLALMLLFVGNFPVTGESKDMVERLKVPPRFGKRFANHLQGKLHILWE